MKIRLASQHSGIGVTTSSQASRLAGQSQASAQACDSLTAGDVHNAHGSFVWATLHRLGVPSEDVPDLFQEVFVTVHRRLHTWDRKAKVTTWLFGICIRVCAAYRRKAHRHRERLVGAPPETPSNATPETAIDRAYARALLRELLDSLTPARRVVFVMFELEGLSTQDIADELGIPQGTVSSRLYKARKEVEAALKRHQARGRNER